MCYLYIAHLVLRVDIDAHPMVYGWYISSDYEMGYIKILFLFKRTKYCSSKAPTTMLHSKHTRGTVYQDGKIFVDVGHGKKRELHVFVALLTVYIGYEPDGSLLTNMQRCICKHMHRESLTVWNITLHPLPLHSFLVTHLSVVTKLSWADNNYGKFWPRGPWWNPKLNHLLDFVFMKLIESNRNLLPPQAMQE